MNKEYRCPSVEDKPEGERILELIMKYSDIEIFDE